MDLNSLKNLTHGLPPWLILGAGFAAGWIKSFWSFIYDHTILIVEKKVHVAITIEEQDHKEAFRWLNSWIEEHLKTRKISTLRIEKTKTSYEDGERTFNVIPGYGFYYLWWNKKLVTFTSSKKESNGSGYDSNKLIRTITLRIWGTRDRETLLKILLEARQKYFEVNPEKMRYYIHRTDYWDDYPLKDRGLDTIYLPDNQLKDLINTVEDFHNSEEKYRNLGIPYRLGILLEGPPGSGKTSIVQALASYFKLRIYYVNLGQLAAAGLQSLLAECEAPCIVLMEDVDCIEAAKNREEDKKDEKTGIKTNELLNLLDGLVATEERIVFMTTNYPEKLDKALVRSGRVDRRFHLGYAANTELRKFYDTACKYYSLPEFEEFRSLLPTDCTIADAQSLTFQIQRKTLDKELELC